MLASLEAYVLYDNQDFPLLTKWVRGDRPNLT